MKTPKPDVQQRVAAIKKAIDELFSDLTIGPAKTKIALMEIQAWAKELIRSFDP